MDIDQVGGVLCAKRLRQDAGILFITADDLFYGCPCSFMKCPKQCATFPDPIMTMSMAFDQIKNEYVI